MITSVSDECVTIVTNLVRVSTFKQHRLNTDWWWVDQVLKDALGGNCQTVMIANVCAAFASRLFCQLTGVCR